MRYKIEIKKSGDLEVALTNFLTKTNEFVENNKNLILTNDTDIAVATLNIKDLHEQEKALMLGKDEMMKIAGITIFDEEYKRRREIRLNLNTQVQNLKQKIKDDAIGFFVKNANILIKESEASEAYKATINPEKIILNIIKCRSKGLMGLAKTTLCGVEFGLKENAIETKQKMGIIAKYDEIHTRDKSYLLSLSLDSIYTELDARLLDYEAKIKADIEREAKFKADEKEKKVPKNVVQKTDNIDLEPKDIKENVVNDVANKDAFILTIELNYSIDEVKIIANKIRSICGDNAELKLVKK